MTLEKEFALTTCCIMVYVLTSIGVFLLLRRIKINKVYMSRRFTNTTIVAYLLSGCLGMWVWISYFGWPYIFLGPACANVLLAWLLILLLLESPRVKQIE